MCECKNKKVIGELDGETKSGGSLQINVLQCEDCRVLTLELVKTTRLPIETIDELVQKQREIYGPTYDKSMAECEARTPKDRPHLDWKFGDPCPSCHGETVHVIAEENLVKDGYGDWVSDTGERCRVEDLGEHWKCTKCGLMPSHRE
jgi:hypothetical protein